MPSAQDPTSPPKISRMVSRIQWVEVIVIPFFALLMNDWIQVQAHITSKASRLPAT